MEKPDQLKLINTICDTIKAQVLQKLEAGVIPEDWDGFELNEYITYLHAKNCLMQKWKATAQQSWRREAKAFNNALDTKPLL